MEGNQNNPRNAWLKQALTIGVIFLAGFYFGAGNELPVAKVVGVENKEPPAGIETDFSPFWEVWNLIDEKYVPPELEDSRITSQEKMWGAIQGMVQSLGDPNTIFLLPSELEIFEREISGNFEGVGMEIDMREGVLTVIAPLKDTPAYKAGIKSGDIIFKIDDKETLDLNVDQAVRLIRGEKGSPVSLTIFREGKTEPLEIEVIRDVIDIPTIDTEWMGDVFVIRLYNFSAMSPALFREALREFIETKPKHSGNKIVLDLRGNPGGFLEASIDIASWFLPAGKVVVKEDFGDKRDEISYRSKGYNIFNKNLKMVVLIDGGSASASEILAGALSEHGVATLVGSQSFGKGSVQELLKVTSDTSLKVTIARWVTPEGKSISLEGLTPDIVVEIEDDVEEGEDPVLQRAIDLLKNNA